MLLFHMPINVLDDDDGVIDHQSNGNTNANNVNRLIEYPNTSITKRCRSATAAWRSRV